MPDMRLNKNHKNEYEDIAPPMRNAVTIPVEGTNVVIYVCGTLFNPASRQQVAEVVKRLSLTEKLS